MSGHFIVLLLAPELFGPLIAMGRQNPFEKAEDQCELVASTAGPLAL